MQLLLLFSVLVFKLIYSCKHYLGIWILVHISTGNVRTHMIYLFVFMGTGLRHRVVVRHGRRSDLWKCYWEVQQTRKE